MKKRQAHGIRKLERAVRSIMTVNPASPEQQAVLDAGVKLRAAKGIYRDAYTPDEFSFLRRVVLMAREHGQNRLAMFCLTRDREKEKLKIPLELEHVFHACPQCGTFHRDDGAKTLDTKQIGIESSRYLAILKRINAERKKKRDALKELARMEKKEGA